MLAVAGPRLPGGPGQAICGDAARLPFAAGTFGLVFSNLVLHWCPDLDGVLREIRRVLTHPGLFSFSTLGPASFRELREAWAEVDQDPHVMAFPEAPSLASGLLRAGFAEPVVDVDTLTIQYRDLGQLLRDLRATGTTNAAAGRRRGLTGPDRWRRFAAAWDRRRDGHGRLAITLEIICGQAWAPPPETRRAREVSIPAVIPTGRPGG